MYYKNGQHFRDEIHWRLYEALVNMGSERGSDPATWIEREHLTMLDIVNDERQKRGRSPLTLADVERAEQGALGHFDYGRKFALYCSELVEDAFVRP